MLRICVLLSLVWLCASPSSAKVSCSTFFLDTIPAATMDAASVNSKIGILVSLHTGRDILIIGEPWGTHEYYLKRALAKMYAYGEVGIADVVKSIGWAGEIEIQNSRIVAINETAGIRLRYRHLLGQEDVADILIRLKSNPLTKDLFASNVKLKRYDPELAGNHLNDELELFSYFRHDVFRDLQPFVLINDLAADRKAKWVSHAKELVEKFIQKLTKIHELMRDRSIVPENSGDNNMNRDAVETAKMLFIDAANNMSADFVMRACDLAWVGDIFTFISELQGEHFIVELKTK